VSYSIGVDIGGTFTDIVLMAQSGAISTFKTLTTPDDFGRGIAAGVSGVLESQRARASEVGRVIHATTVATNAILEHKGARTGLLTTAGFRDVLEMRRLRIPEMYALNYPRPEPLVPRRLRLEATERLAADGTVRVPLNEASVRRAAERFAAERVESVAVSLLHAYANAVHEKRAAAILRDVLGKEVFITCSSDILPVIREYERTSTTVINAFLGPTLARYFDSLKRHLGAIGIDAPIHVMKSDGGVMTIGAAAERPAYLVESGPAAGVIGAAAGATEDVITFDMGGTTAKVSVVEGGKVQHTGDYEVGAGINLSSKLVMGGGYALKLPVIDISEVGAGGGSLVSIDAGGLLRVGPQSAGAMPGPVCYDQGGRQATFTDAALVLGYLNAQSIAGGGLRLAAAKGRSAIAEQVAKPLAKNDLEAAYGVLQVAASTMVRAVKAVTTYRGRDPRDFALYAFGGNGPLVAAIVANLLEMKRVLVPPNPGVFSAYGLLHARVEHEVMNAFLVRLRATTPQKMGERLAALEREILDRMAAEAHPAKRIEISRFADLRYAGQAHEITTPIASEDPDFLRLARDFGDEHERTYGHQAQAEEVECVALRVVARLPAELRPGNTAARWASTAARRDAYFGPPHGSIATSIVSRADLASPKRGPLIVEEYDSTCVIPPGWTAALDTQGNLVLSHEKR
jgi:N-methylhydantoinase A